MGPCVSSICGVECVIGIGVCDGPKDVYFFIWLPMYCGHSNFKACVIWALDMFWAFQEWLDKLWMI